jgi:hypothetical protein
MGMDIHSYVETFDGAAWSWNRGDLFDIGPSSFSLRPWEPFDRSYGLFGFLAGMRNHDVPQIHPCRGLPDDVSPEVRAELGLPLDDLMVGKTDSWSRMLVVGRVERAVRPFVGDRCRAGRLRLHHPRCGVPTFTVPTDQAGTRSRARMRHRPADDDRREYLGDGHRSASGR